MNKDLKKKMKILRDIYVLYKYYIFIYSYI